MIAIVLALIAAGGAVMAAWVSARQTKKISETHKQVTVNSHSSSTPTVLDVISDLRDDISEVRDEQIRVRLELADNTKAMERHLSWHLGEDRQ